MRYAVYYTPGADDPLFSAGNHWLGRDPETGRNAAQPDHADMAAITGDARRYGFHATLKAPIRLNGPAADFRAAIAGCAARAQCFALPRLQLRPVGGFLALVPAEPCPALHALADACVRDLDRYRAPPTPDELQRRHAAGLTSSQRDHLARWGYPDVFADWQFHMTLSRRLNPEELAVWLPRAEAHFANALPESRAVRDICLFIQPAPAAAFLLAERFPLRAAGQQ